MLVQKYGEYEWGLIASQMQNRTARQCRERYQNYLRYSTQKRKWSLEEDNLLRYKYQEIGPRWKLMEQYFPGRSSVNIRNRFYCLRRYDNLYSSGAYDINFCTFTQTQYNFENIDKKTN